MTKRQIVEALLEITSKSKNEAPTKSDGKTMDLEKFYEMEEIKAIITLLKLLEIDRKWLDEKGFMVASLLLGEKLEKKEA